MPNLVDLDLELKTAEPDRWLSTRFIADPEKRADVVAFYAFDHALARIAHAVTQPMLGDIRLAWWREAVEEAVAGKPPRAHPVVEALSVAIGRRGLSIGPFETLIEARARDLDAAPLGLAEAVRYAEASAGSVMSIAARLLGPHTIPDLSAVGRAWGVARLATERRLTPDVDAQDIVAKSLAQTPKLSSEAFPAIAYATLARDYARGRTPSAFGKQLRLFWAVARGSI
ncbi:MAG TPA: squalene/phytoene synthase family protein [Caulobacteraceae bacterium]|nr:squalene/phytoene synthase family protein [Caulobacteraceae bacterium]